MRYAGLLLATVLAGCAGGGMSENQSINVPTGTVGGYLVQAIVPEFRTTLYPIASGLTFDQSRSDCQAAGGDLMTDLQYSRAKSFLYQTSDLEWVKSDDGVDIEARAPNSGDEDRSFMSPTAPGIAYRCAYSE